ncbi:MAG: chlorophyllase [Actinomycetales bacterium]|nr:chlorophyllase [Actinomycetales bacterium]
MTTATSLAQHLTLLAPAARGIDLDVRVSAPATGEGLPVILVAHGFAEDRDAYGPLVDHWVAQGFAVVQPTFLDSAALGLTPQDPRYPTIWRTRVDDLVLTLDRLDEVLGAIPGLAARTDTSRIAAAGHSWGAQSVSMLLGARVLGPDGRPGEDRTDARVTAGVLLAITGTGESLTDFAREHFAFMDPDFSGLRTPSLVVAGDADQSQLSTRGPDWFTDAHRLAPGAQELVVVPGGDHFLGGIHAYDTPETAAASPEHVQLVRESTTTFLRRTLDH